MPDKKLGLLLDGEEISLPYTLHLCQECVLKDFRSESILKNAAPQLQLPDAQC